MIWDPFPSVPSDTRSEETQRSAYYSLFKDRGSGAKRPLRAGRAVTPATSGGAL